MKETLRTFPSDINKPFHLKYRPNHFDEVIGQEHIVDYFKSVIFTRRISFAYLFIGKHGVGKTTISRIIAKVLNCPQYYNRDSYSACDECVNCINITLGKSFDVHEINAALNTGIDSIRDLIEKIQFSSVSSSYKICIIDEVHMLSINAFNALLKVLEAPPKNVVFILATTEIKRVPNTVVSRCHKLFFLPVSKINLALSISNIVWLEGGHITNKALLYVLNSSRGSLRDALNLIDMFMTRDINITESNCTSLSTEIPCSVSKLFFSYLVSGNITSLLQMSHYIQTKKWLEDSLINQIQRMLEDEIIRSDSSSLKSEYLVSIWQLLLKYQSNNFSSTDFSSLIFQLINIYLRSPVFKESNTLVGRKKIPSFIKIKDVYTS